MPEKTPTNGKPGAKRGAPRDNRNALRHGLRGGQLPADAKYVENRLNAFRRNLEDAVLVVSGEVDIPAAAAIQTALRWERHACLAQRWLTKAYDELKPLDRLHFSREIARASTERDKAIATLELGTKDNRPWMADAITVEPKQ
ncbi:MAG: hypothetical protein IID44_27320 [Planctomycetes bacterium]|nr:hypothetical protein [Planctomycetota bacterium]